MEAGPFFYNGRKVQNLLLPCEMVMFVTEERCRELPYLHNYAFNSGAV